MKKPHAVPSLIVIAIAVAIVLWAYSKREVEVHATVTVPDDEIVIGPILTNPT